MSNWFECKVKYQKLDQQGKVKSVTEPYLIDAVSFTEAESRINKEMEPYISGDFVVTNIKVANYAEIIPGESGDRWYKAKVSYITIDEEKGMERKSNSYMLVRASDLKEAYDLLDKDMSGSVSDYEISAIAESPILDIFPYDNSFSEINTASDNDNFESANDFESGDREFESADNIEEDVEEENYEDVEEEEEEEED